MSTVDRVALIEAQINALKGYIGRMENRIEQLESVLKIVGSWAVVNKQFLDSVLETPKPPEVTKPTPEQTAAVNAETKLV